MSPKLIKSFLIFDVELINEDTRFAKPYVVAPSTSQYSEDVSIYLSLLVFSYRLVTIPS